MSAPELISKAKTSSEPTRRDRLNIAVARFLDHPTPDRAGARPSASNVGSRDVTWASQPQPLIPFRVFSRVSRAPFLGNLYFAANACDREEPRQRRRIKAENDLSRLEIGP